MHVRLKSNNSCRSVALCSLVLNSRDRVPESYSFVPTKKPFNLRRRFFIARFDINFSKCLHCNSKSEIHKIRDIWWGQNVIDKVKLMIFVPVLDLKRNFQVCFVMFQVNNFFLLILHFVRTQWKYWNKRLCMTVRK